MTSDGTTIAYRCTFCNINWSDDGRWMTCPGCGETTAHIRTSFGDEVLNHAQSMARAYIIQNEQARAAELERQEGVLTATKAERTANAAAASLAYDLDRAWLEAAPAYLDAWANGRA